MRVKGKPKIDRIGLTRAARKFGIAPVFVDALKRGQVVELPDEKAEAMIARGYVQKCGGRPPLGDLQMDDRNIATLETVEIESDDETDDDDDDDIEEKDSSDEITLDGKE